MALITTDDLEARLGRNLTGDELARAAALCDDVTAAIVSETGQTFTLATTTQHLKVRYGIVRLPQRPVASVTAVEDRNDNDVTYEWDQADRLDVRCQVFDTWSMEPYRTPLQYVDVTYVHGYETAPADIVGVACSMALRALGQSPTDGAIVSEQIDDYSYRIGATGAAGAFGVLPDERRVLDRYKRRGGTMALAR